MIRRVVLFNLKPRVARSDPHPEYQVMVAIAKQFANWINCDYEF